MLPISEEFSDYCNDINSDLKQGIRITGFERGKIEIENKFKNDINTFTDSKQKVIIFKQQINEANNKIKAYAKEKKLFEVYSELNSLLSIEVPKPLIAETVRNNIKNSHKSIDKRVFSKAYIFQVSCKDNY